MNAQNLKNFIELVTFDQNFFDLEQRKKSAQSVIANIESKIQDLKQKLDQQLLKKRDIQKQLHEQELKVQELQEQEAARLKIVQEVTSPKEQEAANKELEYIKLSRNEQEQRMIYMMNKVALSEKESESFLQNFAQEEEALQSLIVQEKTILKDVENNISRLQQERQNRMTNIPQDWISNYEMMRGRVPNPVVPVLQDSCTACFYFMSARDKQLLRQNSLLQCKDCYRFLYEEPSA